MAKTQFSFSDDQTRLGAPRGFKITVREVKVNAGAGFLVAKTGDIMTMPGLPKVPASERIDIDENGKICLLYTSFIRNLLCQSAGLFHSLQSGICQFNRSAITGHSNKAFQGETMPIQHNVLNFLWVVHDDNVSFLCLL